jgi:hypothetical protein
VMSDIRIGNTMPLPFKYVDGVSACVKPPGLARPTWRRLG